MLIKKQSTRRDLLDMVAQEQELEEFFTGKPMLCLMTKSAHI